MVIIGNGRDSALAPLYPLFKFGYSPYLVGVELTKYNKYIVKLIVVDVILISSVLWLDFMNYFSFFPLIVSFLFISYTTARIKYVHKIIKIEKGSNFSIRMASSLQIIEWTMYYISFVGLYVFNLEDREWILRPVDYFLIFLFGYLTCGIYVNIIIARSKGWGRSGI